MEAASRAGGSVRGQDRATASVSGWTVLCSTQVPLLTAGGSDSDINTKC